MAKVICVVNQKGGVGKTTTVVNLSASLAAAQKKTLFIDFDPQGNASSGVGVEKEELESTIYNVILEEATLENTIMTVYPELLGGYLSISPSNAELTGAEVELIQFEEREWKLKQAIDTVRDKFDYILIDCPPSLSLLTVNALTASNSVLIPVQCEYYALEGLGQLQRTISLIKQRLNPELSIEGYLLTMFDSRNNICHSVADEVRSYFNQEVFDTIITRNVKLAESPSYGKPLLLYDIKSPGAGNYISLANELLEKNSGERY
ncbi:MAG: ParA family protein [Thermodesulfobacteriota bacterium]